MIVEHMPANRRGATESLRSVVVGRPLLTLGLAVAAYLPLLASHAAWLWRSSNYGFALLLPPFILFAAADRLKDVGTPQADRPRLSRALAMLAAAFLAAAIYAWFPWLAAVSFVVLVLSLIYGVGGSSAARALFPVWLLLCLTIPLPFGFDEDLTVRLRAATVGTTSGVLDLLDIEHVREGSTLRLVDASLFVSDACSGIHSFFVSVAATFAFIVWRRLGVVRGALLLAAAVAFVLVENVARLTIVAAAWRAGNDLRSGLPHELLGIGLFITTILLIGGAYRLLEFLTAPGSRSETSSGSRAAIEGVAGTPSNHSTLDQSGRSWRAAASIRVPGLGSLFSLALAAALAAAAWASAARGWPSVRRRWKSDSVTFKPTPCRPFGTDGVGPTTGSKRAPASIRWRRTRTPGRMNATTCVS